MVRLAVRRPPFIPCAVGQFSAANGMATIVMLPPMMVCLEPPVQRIWTTFEAPVVVIAAIGVVLYSPFPVIV